MTQQEREELLQDSVVRDEIDRHKWFESEKAGYDIGFEKAAEDWICRYAEDWLNERCAKAQEELKPKKRSAKSYLI